MSWDSRSPSGALLVAPSAEEPAAPAKPEGAGAPPPLAEPADLARELAALHAQAGALRVEVLELRQLTEVLTELLADKGLLDADELRARLANARRPPTLPTLPREGAHPYRGSGKSAEPPPPGTVACARCGTFIAERKAFLNANGRFCRDCFEPG